MTDPGYAELQRRMDAVTARFDAGELTEDQTAKEVEKVLAWNQARHTANR